MSKNLIIDLGKNEIKGLSLGDNGEILDIINFPSVIKKQLNPFNYTDECNDNQYKFEFNNKKYLIGEGVDGTYNYHNSKVNEHHRTSLLLAIGLLLDDAFETVNISMGIPSSHFRNTSETNKYIEFMKGESFEQPIEIFINGKMKQFFINDIKVYPEGIGFYPRLKNLNLINKYPKVVIDIGGHNLNCRRYTNLGNYDNLDFSIEEIGVNNLIEHITDSITSNIDDRDRYITTSDVFDYIKSGYIDSDIKINNYDSSSEFIEEIIVEYINSRILPKLSSRGVKTYSKGVEFIFTGGGSLLLEKYFKKVLNENLSNITFSKTAKWDNCISYAINTIKEERTIEEENLSQKRLINFTKEIDSKLKKI